MNAFCGSLLTKEVEVRRSDDMFDGAGRLFMVVTRTRTIVSFTETGGRPTDPTTVNRKLEDMGLSVRVDSQGRPFGIPKEEACPAS